jgi:hypothetical protein
MAIITLSFNSAEASRLCGAVDLFSQNIPDDFTESGIPLQDTGLIVGLWHGDIGGGDVVVVTSRGPVPSLMPVSPSGKAAA